MGIDEDQGPETERVRHLYDRAARPLRGAGHRSWLIEDGREWLCRGAQGKTLEIGIGVGQTLGLYPHDVDLVGIDLSPASLAHAGRRARELGVACDLRVGDTEHLVIDDASFDTVVVSLVLCSVPDPQRAAAEIARVLRPGGHLRALEHVGSDVAWVRVVQRLLDPVAVRLQADHLLREPADDASAAGLHVDSLERHRMGLIERLVATRPP